MKSKLPSAQATEFYDFMVAPPPEVYARWLPDEHHEFHVAKRGKETPVGDLIYFDQHISPKYRLKIHAIIRIANKPSRVVFQMRKLGVNLPGHLELAFIDTAEGLLLTETIRIGFSGFGKILDPVIRVAFNKSFFKEMNAHHKREWVNLAEILQGGNP